MIRLAGTPSSTVISSYSGSIEFLKNQNVFENFLARLQSSKPWTPPPALLSPASSVSVFMLTAVCSMFSLIFTVRTTSVEAKEDQRESLSTKSVNFFYPSSKSKFPTICMPNILALLLGCRRMLVCGCWHFFQYSFLLFRRTSRIKWNKLILWCLR